RLVRIEVARERVTNARREIGVAANYVDLIGIRVVHPDGKRRAPVSVARYRPVDVVLQPLAEAARADFGRMPVDRGVASQHVVLEAGGAYEPRRACVIQQRRVAAPAVRITVLVLLHLPQSTTPLELLDDDLVGILDPHATNQRQGVGKPSARIDRLQECESVSLARGVIVRAESGSHVHDARTILGGDERLADDYLVRAAAHRNPIERAMIAETDELGAGESGRLLPAVGVIVTQQRVDTSFRKYERALAFLSDAYQLDVLERRIHGERDVRNERPWRGRPDLDSARSRRRSLQCQRYVCAWILHGLVALRNLVR